MTDIQLAQSSKKKHKRDRKDADDPSVIEREEKRKKRKERKREREGATDGARSFSFVFRRLTGVPLYAHTVVEVKIGKGKKSTAILVADEPGACHAHP
jgi:hypothetical protein